MSMVINSDNFSTIDYNFKMLNVYFLRKLEKNQKTEMATYFEKIRIEMR